MSSSFVFIRRTLSQPLLKIEDMEYQKFDSDYDASFQEVSHIIFANTSTD